MFQCFLCILEMHEIDGQYIYKIFASTQVPPLGTVTGQMPLALTYNNMKPHNLVRIQSDHKVIATVESLIYPIPKDV